jgi:iron complex transport system substrate-binding protein
VDIEKLNKLKPDVIITQTQCEVCAVSLKDVEQAVCKLIESRPKIISLEPNSLLDVWRDFQLVADGLGVSERGGELIQSCKKRILEIVNKTSYIDKKPKVACIEWIEPLMSAGNWMPELVEMAGGVNLFGEAGKHSPFMKFEELIEKDPDIIFISPCGFDIERTLQEISILTQKQDWKNLKAVKNKHVYIADGNQYFNRPGPRLVESLEILSEILHPNIFQFEHKNKGYILL